MAELNWMQAYAASEVVEDATEGRLTRREMMARLVAICGTPALATAFLAACASDTTTPAASDATGGTPTGGSTSAGPGTAAGGTTTTGALATGPTTTAGAPTEPATTTPAPSDPATTTATAPGPSTTAGTGGPPLAVAADDPAVRSEAVTFPGPTGPVFGQLSRPAAGGRRPGIIVIHEIRGLTDHIRDVSRRLAKAGYVALAVDLASRAGGTDQAANVSGALTQGSVDDRVADLDAGLAFLQAQPDVDGRIGVTGFCFGGGMTLSYAAAQPAVLAAVPYYGPTPQPPSVMRATNAAVLAHYAGDDPRVNAGIDALTEAMAGKTFETRVYDGARHGFNNDTGGNYDETAAVAAWQATLDWFARHLR